MISSLWAVLALRMRVSMSAMGSVITMTASSPRRLRDAGQFALVRHLAEADPAEQVPPVDGAGPSAPRAPRVRAHAELRRPLLLLDQCLLRHPCPLGRIRNV